MEIEPNGEIAYYELAEGVIRSAQRMTYTDVNAIIEAGLDAGCPIRVRNTIKGVPTCPIREQYQECSSAAKGGRSSR